MCLWTKFSAVGDLLTAMRDQKILLYAFLALICYIGIIDGEPYFREDYKYFAVTKAYYKYHQSNIPWSKAKLTCESEGAFLYYPEDGNEVDKVKTLYRDNIWIWLGASRQDNGEIKSIDGADLLYHKWDIDEPNNLSGAEHCVVLMDDDGKMNDYHCHALYSFVCKQTVQNIESGMVEISQPEKYAEKIGKSLVGHRNFYQYYAHPATWEDAKKHCEQEAATLLFPENEVEAGIIVDYTNQTYWRDWIWVGAYKNNQYTAVDGRPLEEVYVNWSPTQPKGEKCVVLCRDGCYRVHDCYGRFPFICKTSVFVNAIKPEKGLMSQSQPSVGDMLGGVPVQNPYEVIQNLFHNHSQFNCNEGNADCKTTCGIVDKESKSHTFFGNVVGEELQSFPVNKKLDTMYAIMKIITDKWVETENECKKVVETEPVTTPIVTSTPNYSPDGDEYYYDNNDYYSDHSYHTARKQKGRRRHRGKKMNITKNL